ncbi:hypothetical protein MBANPS3_005347 [Mucor bainieri]
MEDSEEKEEGQAHPLCSVQFLTQQESHIVAFCFRRSAIKKLRAERKLSNPVEALSLNGMSTQQIRGKRPDPSSDVNGRNVFLAELKTKKHCQNRSDLVKLGTLMKDVVHCVMMKNYSREDVRYTVFSMQLPSTGLYPM